MKAKLERRLNALEAKDFEWPCFCYTVRQEEGETLEEACKRLHIPAEVVGPDGKRVEPLIISLAV